MKPLARWTISKTCQEGVDCLIYSIKNWKLIYPEFDTIVCHNNLSRTHLGCLRVAGVELIDQTAHTSSLRYPPFDTAWKLYPPRLRLNAHEIIIDNDLVIYKRCPLIDRFLEARNQFVITEAHKRYYGQFDCLIGRNMPNTNSGFIGFPPGYDLQAALNGLFMVHPNKGWLTHFDEEGAVTFLMRRNLQLIPMQQVYACHPKLPFCKGEYGCHFVALNGGFVDHWRHFLTTQN
jgi:hypothetical protein